MPTSESADVFAELVAARARLSEVTKELNEAHANRFVSIEFERKYVQLQKEWGVAFKNFETATDEFSAVVYGMKGHLDSGQE